jgi:hypothetical protein
MAMKQEPLLAAQYHSLTSAVVIPMQVNRRIRGKIRGSGGGATIDGDRHVHGLGLVDLKVVIELAICAIQLRSVVTSIQSRSLDSIDVPAEVGGSRQL